MGLGPIKRTLCPVPAKSNIMSSTLLIKIPAGKVFPTVCSILIRVNINSGQLRTCSHIPGRFIPKGLKTKVKILILVGKQLSFAAEVVINKDDMAKLSPSSSTAELSQFYYQLTHSMGRGTCSMGWGTCSMGWGTFPDKQWEQLKEA